MRGTPFLFSGWTGGLNTIDSPYTIQDDESRDCLNVVATTRGAIQKRAGSVAFVSSPPAVELTSIFPVTIVNSKWLIAFGGTKVYSINTAGAATDITGSATVTTGSRWCVVEAPLTTTISGQGPIYMSNGIDPPLQWSGSGNVAAWTAGSASFSATLHTSTTVDGIPPVILGNLVAGMAITGTNIPAGTIIASIDLLNLNITISNAATASATVTATVSPTPYYATGVPNGRYMLFHQNRIWMTGVSTDMSAVYFSDIVPLGSGAASGDPSSWPIANVVRFDSSDGFPVTGIGEVGPWLVVFKEHKSWTITDPNTGANRQLQHGIGCVAHRTIQATPQGTFFLTAEHGVYVTTGTQVSEVSYKVRPTILQITQSQRQNACATVFNNHYYLSFPYQGSTANNRTLDFDLQLKAWWLHDLAANEYTTFEPAGIPLLYAAIPGTSNGVVQCFVPGVYTDRGSPYVGAFGFSAYWFSAWQRFYAYFLRHRNPMPMVKKRVRQVYFNGSGVIVPMVFKNFQTAGTQTPATVNNGNQYAPVLPVAFATNNQTYGNADTAQVYGGTTYQGVQMIFGGVTAVGDARMYALGTAEEWSVGFGSPLDGSTLEIDAFSYSVQTRKS